MQGFGAGFVSSAFSSMSHGLLPASSPYRKILTPLLGALGGALGAWAGGGRGDDIFKGGINGLLLSFFNHEQHDQEEKRKFVYDKDLKANVEVLEEVKIVAPKPKIGAAPFIYAIFQGVSNWISSMSRPTMTTDKLTKDLSKESERAKALQHSLYSMLNYLNGRSYSNIKSNQTRDILYEKMEEARMEARNSIDKTWDPITDKRIKTLDTRIQASTAKFINTVSKSLGINLRITDAHRSIEEQDRLYAEGRTQPGRISTWAIGGKSFHNYGLAFDVVIMREGKPIWNPISSNISSIGKKLGFEWGGDWTIDKKDYPHFQMPLGQKISDLQKQYNLNLQKNKR